jgi:hypothetical protein
MEGQGSQEETDEHNIRHLRQKHTLSNAWRPETGHPPAKVSNLNEALEKYK